MNMDRLRGFAGRLSRMLSGFHVRVRGAVDVGKAPQASWAGNHGRCSMTRVSDGQDKEAALGSDSEDR